MPGMLYQAQKDFRLDLTRTLFIGDDERDEIAANAADCPFEWVRQDASLYDIAVRVTGAPGAPRRVAAE